MTVRAWLGQLRRNGNGAVPSVALDGQHHQTTEMSLLDLDPDDPLVDHLRDAPGPVGLAALSLASPTVRRMLDGGITLVVPLVNQGEVIGVLALGARRGGQAYLASDRAFLTSLAAQMAPAVRVAQMVRQQQADAQARERIEQEMRVARLIQQTLLPRALPELPGWHLATDYRPARAVGGDFYDFLELADGRLGIIIADVTSKGVPAALVMATTRSVLRATALQFPSPGQVLGRANELLCPDMPPNMFVTCFYALLDPDTGRLSFANAGHPLPYLRREGGVEELRATGMPLGLMPDACYQERDITIGSGESILFYSDGLVEAHDGRHEMLGLTQLRQLVAAWPPGDRTLIEHVVAEFTRFTGADWDPEDDVTLVTLQRGVRRAPAQEDEEEVWRTLADWDVPSEPGNDRLAMERVAVEIGDLGLPPKRLERLKTAVAEAVLNATEHGNGFRPDRPVRLQIRTSQNALSVRVTDQGGGDPIVSPEPPDLEAKLAARQPARGWGLFLIEQMVDDVWVTNEGTQRTVELVLRLGGTADACPEV